MRRVFNLELLFPVFILTVISLTTLLVLDKSLFENQLLSLSLGFLAFIVFSFIDYRFLKNFALPIFIVSICLLFLLLILGGEVRGAVRWLGLANLKIQISEILKPFLLIAFVSFLTSQSNKISFLTFVKSLVLVGIIILPIFIQPDFGNTLIYFFTSLLILIFYGMPIWWFGIIGVSLLALMPIFWRFLREYQKQRIFTFLNPNLDPLGSSYNLIQAMIAAGSGQFAGRGLGYGTQSQLKFLPERHTDFIFATISENFGFIGSILILAAFTFLLFKIYKITQKADSSFGALLGAGAFSLIFLQVFINIGGNIGIVPITGITLPLVSYGGSSLLSTFILLGILNSISQDAKKRETLEIR